MHLSVCRYRWIKNSFAGPKRFPGSRGMYWPLGTEAWFSLRHKHKHTVSRTRTTTCISTSTCKAKIFAVLVLLDAYTYAKWERSVVRVNISISPPSCFNVRRSYWTENQAIIHFAYTYVSLRVLWASSLPSCLCLYLYSYCSENQA